MTTTRQLVCEENDGWLLALLSFACSEFGWQISYVLDEVSVLSLLLLMRQKLYSSGQSMIKLVDKEYIDTADWSKAVEENHKKIAQTMTKTK